MDFQLAPVGGTTARPLHQLRTCSSPLVACPGGNRCLASEAPTFHRFSSRPLSRAPSKCEWISDRLADVRSKGQISPRLRIWKKRSCTCGVSDSYFGRYRKFLIIYAVSTSKIRCSKNVVVYRSYQFKTNRNESSRLRCNCLRNIVKSKIFRTVQKHWQVC